MINETRKRAGIANRKKRQLQAVNNDVSGDSDDDDMPLSKRHKGSDAQEPQGAENPQTDDPEEDIKTFVDFLLNEADVDENGEANTYIVLEAKARVVAFKVVAS